VKNGLTRDDRQKIVDILDFPSLVLPINDLHSHLAGRIFQNAMVGFVLGCLIGMILHFSPRLADLPAGGLYVVSGICYALVCALISYSEHSLGGWKAVMGLGTIAGMISSLLFVIGVRILRGTVFKPGVWEQITATGTFGAMFGAMIVLLAFHAREISLFSQVRWLSSTLQRVLFFGGLAGMGMILLSYLAGGAETLDPGRILRSFLIGFIAAVGLVLSTTENSPTANRSRPARGG
jgi:hypothetical protein